MTDIFSREIRSKIMASIKGRDTKIELKLRQALWKKGIRGYRVNLTLPGKPDIVFPKYMIAIFCDGDFWHGRAFDEWKNRLNPHWLNKIQNNIKRDKVNDVLLREKGWTVIHFWEKEILSDLDSCIEEIIRAIERKKTEK